MSQAMNGMDLWPEDAAAAAAFVGTESFDNIDFAELFRLEDEAVVGEGDALPEEFEDDVLLEHPADNLWVDVPVEAHDSADAELTLPYSFFENDAEDHVAAYRRRAIERWREKRERRRAGLAMRRHVVARSEVAKKRPRVGGRFISQKSQFVTADNFYAEL